MPEPLNINSVRFTPTGAGKQSRIKVGELCRVTGGYDYLPNGSIDFSTVRPLNSVKVADVYVELDALPLMTHELLNHPAGVVGLNKTS